MEARKRWPVELPLHKGWTFITSHAQVLLVVARDPHVRVSEIAEAVGITERYTYRLLSDLQKAGYVTRSRHGRRNEYRVNSDVALSAPVLEEQLLRELLRLIDSGDRSSRTLPNGGRVVPLEKPGSGPMGAAAKSMNKKSLVVSTNGP